MPFCLLINIIDEERREDADQETADDVARIMDSEIDAGIAGQQDVDCQQIKEGRGGIPLFAGCWLGETFLQKQGDEEGETASIGSMGGDEAVMSASIIIYNVYPFGDAAILA